MARNVLPFFALTLIAVATGASAEPVAGYRDALKAEAIGLLPSDSFRLRPRTCTDCGVATPNLWYFQHELVAVPADAATAPAFTKDSDRNSDVAHSAATPESAQLAHPSLVWIGSPGILDAATVLAGARSLRTLDGKEIPLELVPQLSTNRSYANDATAAYFSGRQVRMRGTLDTANGQASFTARSIWPSDFALASAGLVPQLLKNASDLTAFVRAPLVSGQRTPDTRLLWERHPGQARAGKDRPVLGIVLSGAQGDDDESLGGHFAVATGRLGANGDWANWAVNNFYNLDSVSEKGILAATVPMDNYLMDLNSGQQYYRPSYMLVAVLNKQRTAAAYQGGVQRVFNHFYRHDFLYRHAAANCTGISVDVFDALGWHIPKRGPTAPLKSLAAYAYVAATDASLASGRKIYDYLNEEQTRLLPAVAFDAIGQDLLQLVGAGVGDAAPRSLSAYERQLQEDIEAILLVRIPQIPSSRAAGSAPVFSFDEFRARVPADQADWKIVPVGARPFPAELRDAGVEAEEDPSLVPLPVCGIGAALALAAFAWRRRGKRRQGAAPAVQAREEASVD